MADFSLTDIFATSSPSWSTLEVTGFGFYSPPKGSDGDMKLFMFAFIEALRHEHPELLGEIDTHDAVMEGVRLVLAHGQRALVLERERLGHREFNLKFTVLTHNFPVDPAI